MKFLINYFIKCTNKIEVIFVYKPFISIYRFPYIDNTSIDTLITTIRARANASDSLKYRPNKWLLNCGHEFSSMLISVYIVYIAVYVSVVLLSYYPRA